MRGYEWRQQEAQALFLSKTWSRSKGGEIAARIREREIEGRIEFAEKNERKGVWFCFWKRGVLQLWIIHFHIFSTINQTYIMIIFTYFQIKYNLVILFFFAFNIILNLSHPSNYSQTLTNFTLNEPTFTFNPLNVNNTNFTLYSTWIHHLPLPPINLEGERGEGRGKFFYF